MHAAMAALATATLPGEYREQRQNFSAALAHFSGAQLNQRLHAYGRALVLCDASGASGRYCQLLLMRGVCYSPVPVGEDPGYAKPYGDYFTNEYAPLFERDLQLMAEMGANAVRVYTLSTSLRHVAFLEAALARNISVIAGFDMGTARESPIGSARGLAYAQQRLQRKVRALASHASGRAIVAWLVGNELNGPWNHFVCSEQYAQLAHHGCIFGEDPYALWSAVNALCAVVEAEALLCSSPIAGVFPPDRFLYPGGPLAYNPSAWFQLAEGVAAGGLTPPPNFTTSAIHFFSANLYPGRRCSPSTRASCTDLPSLANCADLYSFASCTDLPSLANCADLYSLASCTDLPSLATCMDLPSSALPAPAPSRTLAHHTHPPFARPCVPQL